MHAFRIGKLFGIDIRVDWSWLFIFVLLTWNLSTVFAGWHPDWPGLEPIALAGVASIAFFGCILLHELAHSLVAKRFGVKVRSITLFLFGGVSNIEHEPTTPRADFLTAAAGPVASVLLGTGFLLFFVMVSSVSLAEPDTARSGVARLGPLLTLVAWLGPINLAIGVFNMVPAFPLDGGRVLRALLWATSGDMRASTRRVSTIGQLFGWLFIVAGVAMTFGAHVPFFGTGIVGGVWIAFIGWFLHNAASRSYKRLAIDDAFAGHTVAEVMRSDSPTVAPELSLGALVHDHLLQSDTRGVPVVRDEKLLGLVSISDVRMVAPGDWPATAVSTVMRTTDLAVVSPRAPLAVAFELLAQRDVGQLPVLDGSRFVGMLQRRDVARWLELAWGPITRSPASMKTTKLV
jgi:Zn-dependent protease/predicted transcriptional regulator